jgi:hypothetical protein
LINNHLNRIYHFKGNPREIGFAAGRMLGNRLEQTLNHYIANQPIPKDMEKLHNGAFSWLCSLPHRFQEEFEGLAEGANIPLQRLAEFSYIEECDVKQCSGVIYPFENKLWVARNNDSYLPELWGYVTIREVEGRIPTIPIGIVCTIYAFWAEITGKKSQPTEPTHYLSYGGGIENLDTMNIPHSGYSALERRAEYMRRGKSPSGFINGVYNDQNRLRDVPYYDGNRD